MFDQNISTHQNHSFLLRQLTTRFACRLHATMEEHALLTVNSKTTSNTRRYSTAIALLATMATYVKASTTVCFYYRTNNTHNYHFHRDSSEQCTRVEIIANMHPHIRQSFAFTNAQTHSRKAAITHP